MNTNVLEIFAAMSDWYNCYCHYSSFDQSYLVCFSPFPFYSSISYSVRSSKKTSYTPWRNWLVQLQAKWVMKQNWRRRLTGRK